MSEAISSDIEALKKWSRIPKDDRTRILKSFFCSNCGLTTVVHYFLTDSKYGILVKGSCKKCGSEVIRLIEDTREYRRQ